MIELFCVKLPNEEVTVAEVVVHVGLLPPPPALTCGKVTYFVCEPLPSVALISTLIEVKLCVLGVPLI